MTVQAATGTWTGGGAGTWDTTATNWSGVAGTPWDSANGPSNTALFGTVGDAATLSGQVFPGNVTFNESTTVSGTSTNRIQYATTGTSKTFTVAAGKTGTITGDIINSDPTNATQADNILLVAGGGKLVLGGTTRLKSNQDSSSSSYFQIDGGSELDVTTSTLFTFAPAANTGTRGSATNPYLGNSTSGNTLKVTGTGKLMTGNFYIGNSSAGTGSNSVYISAAGTSASPTWDLRGNGPQINMNSSNNLLQIDSGAFVTVTSGGGTSKWGIGIGNFGGNQFILDNASLSRGTNNGVEIGWSALAATSSDGNSVTIQNGATWVGGRVEIASSSGSNPGSNGFGKNNTQLVTGTNSYFRLNGTTNTYFDVALNSGSTGNSFRVGTGGRADVFGSGTTRRTGVGETPGADSNYVEVSGAGAQFNYLHNLPMVIGGNISNSASVITSGGNLNHIDVKNAGSLFMDNTDSTLAAPPANANFVYGANPALSAALVLSGTNSSFNLGDGASIATATIGRNQNFFGVVLGANGGDTNATLNMNNGRLIAGSSLDTGDPATVTLVSAVGGTGASINLAGTGYFSTSLALVTPTVATIGVPITGSGAFHKEGTSTLELTSLTNSYSGDTYIDAGILKLDDDYLSDSAAVRLLTGAKLNLNTGASIDQIAALFFNGVAQIAGTWGSTSSGAANQNDTFFSGTGQLLVPGSVEAVPEPSTLALAGLGLIGLGCIAWRKRRA